MREYQEFWKDLWEEISSHSNGTYVGVWVDHKKKEFYIKYRVSSANAYAELTDDEEIWGTTYPSELSDDVELAYEECDDPEQAKKENPPWECLSAKLWELDDEILDLLDKGYKYRR